MGLLAFYLVHSFILNKVYIARAKAFVSVILFEEEKEMGYNELRASNELAASYMNYIKEYYIIRKYIKELPPGLSREYDYEDIRQLASVDFFEGTYILEFSFENENPEDAIILVNSFSAFALQEVYDLIGVGYFSVFEEADSVEEKEISVNKLLFFSLTPGVLTLLLIFLFDYFKTSYVTKKELKKAFPSLPVLGELRGRYDL